MSKIKLVKIKKGYYGSGDEYQYGDRVFITSKVSRTRWNIFEKPHINANEEIFKSEGDYRPVMKKFRLWLESNIKTSHS
jgi:hypothetical protein